MRLSRVKSPRRDLSPLTLIAYVLYDFYEIKHSNYSSNLLTSHLIIFIDTSKMILSISYGVGNHS
jgi:hypothetical protein